MSDRSDDYLTSALPWASGAMFALIGFFALVIASRTHGSPTYWIGIAVFVLCVLAIFYLIGRGGKKHE